MQHPFVGVLSFNVCHVCILICIHLACNSRGAVHLCFLVSADSWARNTRQIAFAKVYHISTYIYNNYNNKYTYLTDTTQKIDMSYLKFR